MPRRKKMSDAELVRFVEQSIQASTFFNDSEQKQTQQAALDSYYGRNRRKHYEGRSDAVSQDVADMVEAVVAQVMPAFDFDTIAKFRPRGSRDVDQARVETRVCNSFLRDHNGGYVAIQESVRDGLLLENGIIKVENETLEYTTTRSFSGLNALELADLAEPQTPNQKVEFVNPQPNADEPDATDVTVRRTDTLERLAITSVDPTLFGLTKNWHETTLRRVPMCGEILYLSGSDLAGMGVSKKTLEGFSAVVDITNAANTARNRGSDNRMSAGETGHIATNVYEVFELSILVDYDNDGIAERRAIMYAGGSDGMGGTVISNEPAARVPYASGTPIVQPHRWRGMGLFNKLIEIENQKTDAIRQWLDNLNYMNNHRLVVTDGADEESAKASRPGGIIRAETIDDVREIVPGDIGRSSLAFLEYADKMRSERGGASLDLQSAELQLAGETAHGIERQYTSKEQLAQLMTRTMAEMLIYETFWLIHEVLRMDMANPVEIEDGRSFIVADPAEWPYRDEIEIVAGMTGGERAEKQMAMSEVLARQEKLIEVGVGSGILTDLQQYHDALIDWTAASGIKAGSRYFIDPRSPQSIEAQKLDGEQKRQAAVAQQAASDKLFDTQVQITMEQERTKRADNVGKLRFDYWNATLDSKTEQWKINQQNTGELDEQQEPGERETG